MKLNCPQCTEPTETLHEGYCFECWEANQRALDLHNAEYDRWKRMSDADRKRAIAWAARP
ncbi:hypothetical protein ACVIF9_006728 [Bradyrhizobium sp. USDA 4350]